MSPKQRRPKQRMPRILKEDALGLFVIDNYGNRQRPDDRPGYKPCVARAGDRLLFRFAHCGYSSQGFALDGSHWSTR